MSIKLTDTQLVMLSTAAQREDRCLEPPKNLKGGAAQKVAAKLLTAGLVKEIKAKAAMAMWRKCAPDNGEPWPADLRFHPACPFRTSKFPALVALVRDAVTGEPTGIRRTALKDDGSGKREMPDGMSPKMMMGRAKHAAVQLHPRGSRLGIAEGIETALSAHQIFKMPVWAAMSASGIRAFPVIHGIKFLRIFADNDEAGLWAARSCKRRYQAAGIEVEIRHPPEHGIDWNDFHLMEI